MMALPPGGWYRLMFTSDVTVFRYLLRNLTTINEYLLLKQPLQ